jgi:hypothetical protein
VIAGSKEGTITAAFLVDRAPDGRITGLRRQPSRWRPRVVGQSTKEVKMVYPLPQPVEPPEDDVFFRKHRLRVGTALRYYGRSNPGTCGL